MDYKDVFIVAMTNMGNNARHYRPKNKGEVDEWFDILVKRSSSERRKTILNQLRAEIKKGNADEAVRLARSLNPMPKLKVSPFAGSKAMSDEVNSTIIIGEMRKGGS